MKTIWNKLQVKPDYLVDLIKDSKNINTSFSLTGAV